jgi:ribose 5-phosphate isomerase B
MRVGIAVDHGGYPLKMTIIDALTREGHAITDFGAFSPDPGDDFPDFVIPLAKAVAAARVERGIALCGSGVGACIAANKISGARAGLICESFSAHQGVEDDNMNIICVGGRVLAAGLAWELIKIFLNARFSEQERFVRRLTKIDASSVRPS